MKTWPPLGFVTVTSRARFKFYRTTGTSGVGCESCVTNTKPNVFCEIVKITVCGAILCNCIKSVPAETIIIVHTFPYSNKIESKSKLFLPLHSCKSSLIHLTIVNNIKDN